MNRDAYLNPGAVNTLASAAGNTLDEHIAICRQSSEAFARAAGMNSFLGSAAEAFKAQLRDYSEMFDLYISSAQFMQSQIEELTASVGSEILDGAVINDGIEFSDNACKEHINDSIAYREMAFGMTDPALFACKSYLNHVADIYEDMAANDKKIADQWRDKARAYDQIDGSTAGLFGGSMMVISKIAEGLDVVCGAYSNGYYDADRVAGWKGELADVIYHSYRQVQADGTVTINWSAVEASLKKTADHISEAEYEALAAIYTEISPEDMGRFLGLLTDCTERVDNYDRRLSAYGGDHIYEDYSSWTFDQEKLMHLGLYICCEKEEMLEMAAELYDRAAQVEEPSERQQLYMQADQLLAARSDLFKRYLILNLCSDLDTVRSSYDAEGPELIVEQDVQHQYGFSWKDDGNIGQRLGIGKDIYSELTMSHADISTYDGLFMSLYGDELVNTSVLSQVDRSSLGSIIYDFTNGQIKSEVTGALMKELARKVSVEWVEDLPVFDVLEIPFSLYSEYQQTNAYLNETGQSIRLSELSDIYSAFDFEGGYVCVHGDTDTWMMQYQAGVSTETLIDQINAAGLSNRALTLDSFMNAPDDVIELLYEIMEGSNDYDRIRMDAILSGAHR